MPTSKRLLPILLVGFTTFAVAQNGTVPPPTKAPDGWWDHLAAPYEPKQVPPVSFDNSGRLDALISGGKLYLSLDDAIALALENNLDVEIQRFSPATAATDVLRARGGGTVRGLPLTVGELPQGIGGPASPILNLPATGAPLTTSLSTNLPELNSIIPGQSSASISGGATFSTGPLIPAFDAALTGLLNFQHQTSFQTNPSLSGTSTLEGRSSLGTFGFQKGFAAGSQFSAGFTANALTNNSIRNAYNPYTASSLGLTFTQPLLRGFGSGVNERFIRIARNNERVSELVFRQQVISTTAGVIRLYFDLVTLQQDVDVKQQTLALAQRLYGDNREKVEQGTLAPIELVRAQAQVASSRQDLANSEGFELQQELVLKNVLSRSGTADPLLRDARIVPTTPLDIPSQEDLQPIQDLIEIAYTNRPELEEGQLQISNAEISLKGSRNSLLPQLDIVVGAQSNALAGEVNALSAGLFPADPALLGGLGTLLGQLFRASYPTYGIGLQLYLPFKNSVAQADYARDAIQFRQFQTRFQQLRNQVRLEVESALVAVNRSRGAYDAAVEARRLQEQSLEIEMEKYANGLSTNLAVMQYQSYLAQARSTEVAAKSVYAKAKTSLERALGQTLQNHRISIDEAFRGRMSTPPAAVPQVR